MLLNIAVMVSIDPVMKMLSVPEEVYDLMRNYLMVMFCGIFATFLYNFFASLLRAVGNSVTPLVFLGISAVMNIILDLIFVLVAEWGVEGAALATIISQWFSGIGRHDLYIGKVPFSCVPARRHMRITWIGLNEIMGASFLTCMQQSVMNLGILMVQGLVNSFGAVVMAAFAAATKIDAFAYMPLQDFGNSFSTFAAQNYGARKKERIEKGIRSAVISMLIFSAVISILVFFICKTASFVVYSFG